MFNLNHVTRVFRNANPMDAGGSHRPASFTPATTDPFAGSGTNVFADIDKRKSGNEANSMQAPQMNPQGNPQGMNNPPPLEAMNQNNQNQWAPQPQQQAPQQQAPQKQGGSPLDIYNPVADNSPNGGQHPQAAPAQQEAPAKTIWDTDYKGWEGVMSKVDIGVGIEADQVGIALGGGEGAHEAFMNIIQQVSRNAMTQAAHMSTQVAHKGVQGSITSFGEGVPGMINDHKFSNMWDGNKVMSHPSAKPMVDAMTTQFRGQFPNATTEQIQQQVEHFMNNFGQQFTQQQAPAQQEQATPSGGNVSLTDFFSKA